ncbi:MAG TPA: DUF4363 family protein [Symbiobacteriaceae bacterium]
MVKWAVYIVPIVAFAVLLNAGQVLKRPMGTQDDVLGHLHAVEQSVLAEDWAGAGTGWERTQAAVDRVARRIQIDAEKGEMQDLAEELARLRGTIQAQERGPALEHVSVLKSLFHELGR